MPQKTPSIKQWNERSYNGFATQLETKSKFFNKRTKKPIPFGVALNG